MAIADVNVTYSGQGPTDSGQVFSDAASGGLGAQAIEFSGTATLDGAATTFNINWIDGTKTLSFTPSGVILSRVVRASDTGLNTINITPVGGNMTNAKMVATLSAAGTNAQTVSFVGRIVR
jgi:hypothetical protein